MLPISTTTLPPLPFPAPPGVSPAPPPPEAAAAAEEEEPSASIATCQLSSLLCFSRTACDAHVAGQITHRVQRVTPFAEPPRLNSRRMRGQEASGGGREATQQRSARERGAIARTIRDAACAARRSASASFPCADAPPLPASSPSSSSPSSSPPPPAAPAAAPSGSSGRDEEAAAAAIRSCITCLGDAVVPGERQPHYHGTVPLSRHLRRCVAPAKKATQKRCG